MNAPEEDDTEYSKYLSKNKEIDRGNTPENRYKEYYPDIAQKSIDDIDTDWSYVCWLVYKNVEIRDVYYYSYWIL